MHMCIYISVAHKNFYVTAPHRVRTKVKFPLGKFSVLNEVKERKKHLLHKGKQLCKQTRLWNFKLP